MAKKKVNYCIEISYSWGDCEEPYGNFKTPESAYKEMVKLACNEAYIYNEEFLFERTCDVYFDAYNKLINLHYQHDDTYCFYRLKEIV